MTDRPTLRPMRWWDLDAVAALEREAFPDTAWSVETFWAELAGVPVTRSYLVAVDDGRDTDGACVLVGYAGISISGADADVQTVVVRPAWRGRGVATALVEALTQHAAERGVRRLLLEVAADNAPARRLYSQLGFTDVGVRRAYFGPRRDALLMRRVVRGRVG